MQTCFDDRKCLSTADSTEKDYGHGSIYLSISFYCIKCYVIELVMKVKLQTQSSPIKWVTELLITYQILNIGLFHPYSRTTVLYCTICTGVQR